LVDPQVMNLSVETYVPPVWSPTQPYVTGDQVSGPVASNNGVGTFAAVKATLKNLPTAHNSGAWRPTTPQPIAITCNNTRPCILGTTTDGNGQTVTDALMVTDPLPVNIPPGSLIAIRSWINQSGSQVIANGPDQTIQAGSFTLSGTKEADLTLSGSRFASGSGHNTGPFAIVGTQNVTTPVPTVCIIGDSRAAGLSGWGVSYAPLYSGGSGYIVQDIGRLVRNVDTGNSHDDPISSAVYVIQNVVNGSVTQIGIYDPGHYAPTATSSNAGIASTMPNGPQPTRPIYTTGGSGVMVTIPASNGMSGSAGVFEDPTTFAQGFIQKGLSDAGIPFSSFTRSGDQISVWASPNGDVLRLAAIKSSGCSSVIMALGINDVSANFSASAIESNIVAVANQLLALGTVKAVFLATLFPTTSSGDHWSTTSKQSLRRNEVARIAVNDWERTVPAPFAGTFDVAAPVEVNQANVPTLDGGYWIVNGSSHYATSDGTHFTPAIHTIAAQVITANASMFQ
jgi:hypothetical protein